VATAYAGNTRKNPYCSTEGCCLYLAIVAPVAPSLEFEGQILCRMTMLTSLHLEFEWHCKPVGEIESVPGLLEVKISGSPGLAFLNSLLSPALHLRSLEQSSGSYVNNFSSSEAYICPSSSSIRFTILIQPSHPCKEAISKLHP